MVSKCHSVEELRSSMSSHALISTPDGRRPSRFNISLSDSDPSLIYTTAPQSAAYSSAAQYASNDDDSGYGVSPQSPGIEGFNRGRSQQKKSGFGTPSALLSYKRLKSPDRFLPERRFEPAAVESFKLAKNPSQLSAAEKVHRRRDPLDDPFQTPNSARSPLQRRVSSPNRCLSPRNLPRHVEQTALGTWHNPELANSPSVGSRTGPGWTVGGAPVTPTSPSMAIPDGQGRFLGSGTLSPMHIANYKSPGTREEQQQAHQSRLALALDIDQASRVLNCCHTPSPASTPPSSPLQDISSPTWKNSAWNRVCRKICMLVTAFLDFPNNWPADY